MTNRKPSATARGSSASTITSPGLYVIRPSSVSMCACSMAVLTISLRLRSVVIGPTLRPHPTASREHPCSDPHLLEELERVGPVVDEVEARATWLNLEAEEVSRAGRRPGAVDRRPLRLGAGERRLDELPGRAIRADQVTTGCDSQTERSLEELAGGDRGPRTGTGRGEQAVRDGRDAVVERVGDVDGPVRPERHPRRPDDEGTRVGPLREPRPDHDLLRHVGRPLGEIEHEAHHVALVDDGTVGRNGAVQDVRDEEDPEPGTPVVRGQVPRPVDVRATERLDQPTNAVEEVEVAGTGRLGSAVGRGQAAD